MSMRIHLISGFLFQGACVCEYACSSSIWFEIAHVFASLSRIIAFLNDGRLEERKAIREQLSREGNLQVLITHYDLIMRDKAFLKKIHWQYMIVDEGHRLKNHECALAKTIAGYCATCVLSCLISCLHELFFWSFNCIAEYCRVLCSMCTFLSHFLSPWTLFLVF
jgi:hypothetical protein